MKNIGKLITIPILAGLLASQTNADFGGRLASKHTYSERTIAQPYTLKEFPFKFLLHTASKGDNLSQLEKTYYSADVSGHLLGYFNPDLISFDNDGRLVSHLQEGDWVKLPNNIEIKISENGDTFDGLSKKNNMTYEEFRSKCPWNAGVEITPGSVYFIEKYKKPNIQSSGIIEDIYGFKKEPKKPESKKVRTGA